MIHFIFIFIFLYVVYDVNYFVRTLFTVLSSRVQRYHSLSDITTIYGMCTFQDCDAWLNSIRLARLVRELDFARYHFYDRTGIYRRSKDLGIKSLQGCTLTITLEPLPMFFPYKINTKLVYWDNKSLFFEHEVVTLRDGRVRCFLVSRQHALWEHGDSTQSLLAGIPGFKEPPACPTYIKLWLESMKISSDKLRENYSISGEVRN